MFAHIRTIWKSFAWLGVDVGWVKSFRKIHQNPWRIGLWTWRISSNSLCWRKGTMLKKNVALFWSTVTQFHKIPSRKIQALIEHYQKAHNQTFKDEKAGPLIHIAGIQKIVCVCICWGKNKAHHGLYWRGGWKTKSDLKLETLPRMLPEKFLRRQEDREGNRRRKGSGGEGTTEHWKILIHDLVPGRGSAEDGDPVQFRWP